MTSSSISKSANWKARSNATLPFETAIALLDWNSSFKASSNLEITGLVPEICFLFNELRTLNLSFKVTDGSKTGINLEYLFVQSTVLVWLQ